MLVLTSLHSGFEISLNSLDDGSIRISWNSLLSMIRLICARNSAVIDNDTRFFEWRRIYAGYLSFVYVCLEVGDPIINRGGF